MKKKISKLIPVVLLLWGGARLHGGFAFEGNRFMLDGKPFRIMAGEIHFQRVPPEYWRDRLLKARAMGLNAVCLYVCWSLLEPEPGQWDLGGGNDLGRFIRTAADANLRVIVRPGPYSCAEWDFGGLPAWLLRIPDIRVRCSDRRYLDACERYVGKIASIIRDLQSSRGGPVLMVQIENEYGSYGNDREYLLKLKRMWEKSGIEVPFYTADGATPHMLEAGTIPGAAIGLDPAASEAEFAEAAKINPAVPVFASELYPGWMTHWGEKWATVETPKVVGQVQWLLEHGKSFNLYMFHGGTNFGFTAGANFLDRYVADVTSYDYDSPLNEKGEPTEKYFALRRLLAEFQPEGTRLPPLPRSLPAIDIPAIRLTQAASLFDLLPEPVKSPQPLPMEAYGQKYGFILYRTKLVGRHSGRLVITDLHDYANIYVDGVYSGTLDRNHNQNAIDIGDADPPHRQLDILVEAMGRINFGDQLIDRKGITERVTLNGMTLMDWQVYPLPFDRAYLSTLKFPLEDLRTAPPGRFFRGTFLLNKPGDTYLDMSGWKKGVVWVNGSNLGRYWEIGPQTRLFLPAPYLKKGVNEIVVFDLHQALSVPIRGVRRLRD